MIGRVVSIKSKDTATVLVERVSRHPLYKKTYVQSKKYLVDDRVGVKPGDIVEIINSRPISRNKHWKIVKVLGKSYAEIAAEVMMEKAEEAIAEVMPEKESEQVMVEGEQSKTQEVKEEKTKKKEVKK